MPSFTWTRPQYGWRKENERPPERSRSRRVLFCTDSISSPNDRTKPNHLDLWTLRDRLHPNKGYPFHTPALSLLETSEHVKLNPDRHRCEISRGHVERVLISACVMGEKVRYHGGDARRESPILARWETEGRVLRVCPEVAAGFEVPRRPSEIAGERGGDGVHSGVARVVKGDGLDVTPHFIRGAQIALALVREYGIHLAVLKENSPSCGVTRIYDGSFSGRRTDGMGVTASLLRANGVRVFSDEDLSSADRYLAELESRTYVDAAVSSPGVRKLYVGNLSTHTTAETLEAIFAQNGRRVVSVCLMRDPASGNSRGFAFVELASAEEAMDAIIALDGKATVDGQVIKVNAARESRS
jgi:uncharacterized protein YbbK (DUF523 family)